MGRFDPKNLGDQADGQNSSLIEPASNVFSTWSYETGIPLSLEALRTMIRRELPGFVYRCKGILYTADEPTVRNVLQVVGRRMEITTLGDWGSEPPRSRIVAIGSADMDVGLLTRLFDRCVAEPAESQL
ncbi:MAG TPA: GTP-binding protein [Anaerolineales bacterium]|nr:GTP-binding protein [Anaerolineales bacterium]